MENKKFEIKENQGIIFRNRKKTEGDKLPDYSGTINVDGSEKQIALWVKQGKKEKFFSVKISEPYKKETNEQPKDQQGSDDLPF